MCRLAHEHNWAAQGVAIGDTDALPYDYGQLLARSVFCAAATGDGWATRIEDAIQHGCIPVIIHDGVHGPFENILEYDTFSIRIKENAVNEHLPKVSCTPLHVDGSHARRAQACSLADVSTCAALLNITYHPQLARPVCDTAAGREIGRAHTMVRRNPAMHYSGVIVLCAHIRVAANGVWLYA